MGNVDNSICFGWNNGFGLARVEFLAQCVGVKCFVGEYGAEIQAIDQFGYTNDFTSLSRQ